MCQDLGTPVQSAIVNLTINVRDQNDRAPVFTRSLYAARVAEGNTPVSDDTLYPVCHRIYYPLGS